MKRTKIVVVEDENDIREVIEYNLTREDYDVHTTADGEAALELVRKIAPDLVLLDIMLPGLDGIEICRRLKSDPLTSAVPIIMLTAQGEESDIVLGLGVGADDYVTKPFSNKALLARIRAVLRRGPLKDQRGAGERVIHGTLVVDAARHEVMVDGQPIELTATEFRLLHFLASHPGRVFTRDHLVRRVIAEDAVVLDRNIDVHVRGVRKKIGEYRDWIHTVRGVGYRFRIPDDASSN
jgi:two-component system alkaline phosphatase synthesis response regulator PhoP